MISKLFASTVTNGLLGSFSFNENGDPAGASGAVVAINIAKAGKTFVSAEVVSPAPETVAAANGE